MAVIHELGSRPPTVLIKAHGSSFDTLLVVLYLALWPSFRRDNDGVRPTKRRGPDGLSTNEDSVLILAILIVVTNLFCVIVLLFMNSRVPIVPRLRLL